MSDHNFEKQVQQKLDELKIPPADQVWSSIEVRIRKDKRRRRGLILLPFLLLLLGGALYFTALQTGIADKTLVQKSSSPKAIHDKDNSTSKQTTETKDNLTEIPGEEKSSTPNAQRGEVASSDAGSTETTAKPKVFDESTATVTTQPKKLDNGSLPAEPRGPRLSPGNAQKRISRETKERVVVENNQFEKNRIKTIEKLSEETQSPERLVEANDRDKQTNAATDSAKGIDMATKVPTDTMHANDQIIARPVDSSSAVKSEDEARVAKKGTFISRLNWGVSLSIGASSMVEGGILQGGLLGGIIGEEKALVADVAYNANTNASPNNPPQPASYRPSTIERGLSFSAGAFAQKRLSRRFSVSTGLQYRFYSTHIRVGNRVDSFLSVQNASGFTNTNRYYMAAPIQTTHKYTNRFHFLELPVTAHLQLNKGNKLPILWNAGLSLAYLLSTNALHFDGRTGVYYSDNSLFNKLQANLSTGLAISVRNKSTMTMHVGPQFQWSLTNLLKQDVSDKKKLFYLGLGAKVFLNK